MNPPAMNAPPSRSATTESTAPSVSTSHTRAPVPAAIFTAAPHAHEDCLQLVSPGGAPDHPPGTSTPTALDPARLLREEGASRPEDVVRVLLDLYLPGGVRPPAREKLVVFVAEGNPAGAALDRRARDAAHAIMTMPEYQLC